MFGGGQKSTFGNNSSFSTFNTTQQPNTFNTSAFAKPATTFGSPGSFGQTPNTMFGASTPVSTGGIFGSNTATQAPAFGSTFGQQPQQQQQQTSLFGQQPNNSPSVFGAQQQSSLFAAPKPAGFSFGQQMQQPTANSMFSAQPQQNQSSFFSPPQTNTGGLFGSTATPTSTFGASPATAFGQSTSTQGAGTSIAKFIPPQEGETMQKGATTSYVQTKQQCITFMKEYAEKSLEELRQDDYVANRKGPQAGTGLFNSTQTSNVFGAAQPATGSLFANNQTAQQSGNLFGSNPLSATSSFGQQNPGFGQGMFGKPLTTPATTASSTFGGFGATKPLFGAPTTSSGFQMSNTPAFGATSGGFGATNTFNSPAQQGTSLFGSNPAGAAAPFGALGSAAPTSSSGFNFQQPNTSTNAGSLFGATVAKPTFGASFGAPATSTASTFSGGFGQQAQTNNLFNQPKPFGASAPTASSFAFGGTGGSMFGNTSVQPGGGLFGSSNPVTSNTGGGLFGSTNTSSFGGGMNTGGGLSFGLQQPGLFNQSQQNQTAQAQNQEIHQKIISLASNPYGDNELFKGLKSPSLEDSMKLTSPAIQKTLLDSSGNFKVSTSLSSKIKVKPVAAIGSKKSLFDGLEEYDATLEESFSLKSNPKRLIIKPKSAAKPSGNEQTLNRSIVEERMYSADQNQTSEHFNNQIPLTQPLGEIDNDRRVSWLRTVPSQGIRNRQKDTMADTTLSQIVGSSNKDNENVPLIDMSQTLPTTLNDTFHSEEDLTQSEADLSTYNDTKEPHPTGIILRRAGYYTIPLLDEIAELMDNDGRCVVSTFTVGRKGYGNVYFDEEIDVAGLNLDEICHFRNKEIILYPDDEMKPPVGEGLNRRAQVTLDRIWPKDKVTDEIIKDIERLEALDYESKLIRICSKKGTKFLEYRPETGSCVFKVDHFSKYTLDDSDEDGDNEPRTDPKKLKVSSKTANAMGTKILVQQNENVQADPLNSKAQESMFFLGQHVGQKNFQSLPFMRGSENNMEISEEPTSPSVMLAKEMQSDSHKLQLMKASLFVDDDYDHISIESDRSDGRDSPDQIVPTKSVFSHRLLLPSSKDVDSEMSQCGTDKTTKSAVHEIMNKQDVILASSKPVGPISSNLFVRPRVFLLDVNMTLPMKDSIIQPTIMRTNNTNTFFNGRRFKISFGVCNNFTVLGSQHQQDNVFDGRRHDDATRAHIKIAKITSMKHEQTDNFKESIVKHFEVELEHDKRIVVEGSDCPRLKANGGTEAMKIHKQLAQKLLKESLSKQSQFNSTVWMLVNALWGSIDDEQQDPQEHVSIMLRRDLLSRWMASVVNENADKSTNVEYLDKLVNLMTTYRTSEACELALTNNDFHLSLLISQCSGGPTVRQLVQQQLANWHEIEADNYVQDKRLKILMMIAGVSVMEGPKSSTINIFEGLDWLKCLALQLWYLSSPTSSINDVLLSYEKLFNDSNFEIAAPVPPYVERFDQKDVKYQDMRFLLLKLYCQRSQSLETLLHTAGYTSDDMDYRLAFLICQSLESLGYHHLSDSCRFRIYNSLAEQLEAQGLWEWAIWVFLHLADKDQRESAIQRLLYSHILIEGEDIEDNYVLKEKFLVESLMIPEKWISYAKAVRAGAMGAHNIELKYLFKAQQWSKAHEVLMLHIAPDLIINDKFDFLKSLLSQLEETASIKNWKIQGEVLMTFIELNEKFKSLSNNEVNYDEYEFLDLISQKFTDLFSVIKLFPCPTPKHRLTQCEIAKELAFIVRNFYANSSLYENHQSGALLRTSLEKLPLPQEYAQQELKYILKTFMMEKLSIN